MLATRYKEDSWNDNLKKPQRGEIYQPRATPWE